MTNSIPEGSHRILRLLSGALCVAFCIAVSGVKAYCIQEHEDECARVASEVATAQISVLSVDRDGDGNTDPTMIFGWGKTHTSFRSNPFTGAPECFTGEAEPMWFSATDLYPDGTRNRISTSWDRNQVLLTCTGDGVNGGTLTEAAYGPLVSNWAAEYRISHVCANEYTINSVIVSPQMPQSSPDICESCVGDQSGGVCVTPTPNTMIFTAPQDLEMRDGQDAFAINRTYQNTAVTDSYQNDRMFGKGWSGSVEMSIVPVPSGSSMASYWLTALLLIDGRGKRTLYQYSHSNDSASQVFSSKNGDKSTITRQFLLSNSTYYLQSISLRKSDGSVYQFNATGRLQSIQDVSGRTTAFGYSNNKLTNVTLPNGRQVHFDYNSQGRVSALRGPAIAGNPSGLFASYSYDAAGNLARVEYPDATGFAYSYDEASMLTSIQSFDMAGQRIQNSFTYDASGRVTSAFEPDAHKAVSIAYGGNEDEVPVNIIEEFPEFGQHYRFHTHVTEWDDGNGNGVLDPEETGSRQETKYYYDIQMNAQVVTEKVGTGECSSCSTKTKYDNAFRPLERSDKHGHLSQMKYNRQGDIVSHVEAVGTDEQRTTTYEYVYPTTALFPGQILEKKSIIRSVVDPEGWKTSRSVYDPTTGKLALQQEQGYAGDGAPLTRDTVYTYTASGEIASIDGPLPGAADTTTYEYHPTGGNYAGLLWRVTEPAGGVTEYAAYDALGNATRVIDPNGIVTDMVYDGRGRLLSRTQYVGQASYVTTFAYDVNGNLTRMEQPDGGVTANTYDGAGQLVQTTDSQGNRLVNIYQGGEKTREEIYNALGELKRFTDYVYDNHGRLWKTILPDGSFTENVYDEAGTLTETRQWADSATLLKSTLFTYDALDRAKGSVVSDTGFSLAYTYDYHGNMTSVTDPLAQVTSYFYDDFGRVYRQVSPETGTTLLTYDVAGNVLTKTDARGITTATSYDSIGRFLQVNYSDGSPGVSSRYDTYSSGDAYPYALGRLTEVSDAAGLKRFVYDYAGRLIQARHAVDEYVFVTSYGYDSVGRLVTIVYPQGRMIRYDYLPGSSQAVKVTSTKDGVERVLADNITWLPFGPLTGYGMGNGVVVGKEHDNPMYRVTAITATLQGSDLVAPREYSYLPSGNIGSISRSSEGIQSVYGYDQMDRLTSWHQDPRAISYSYDANGNRLQEVVDGQPTDYGYQSSAQNLLASASGARDLTYSHDATGNITGWGTRGFEYNAPGRMSRSLDSGLVTGEYAVASDGQRIKKVTGGVTTYFQYDASGRLIYEYSPEIQKSIDYVFLQSEPLAMIVTEGEPPTFTHGPKVTILSKTSVRVILGTLSESTSVVRYGMTADYGFESTDSTLAAEHAIQLDNLDPNAVYHFQVVSTDHQGATTISGDDTFQINHAPVAADQAFEVDEDHGISFTLQAVDIDQDRLTFVVTEGPTHGTLSGTLPNLNYMPSPNYFGDEVISYVASDGYATSNIGVITIQINPVQEAPVVENMQVATDEDVPAAITLVASDADNDPLTYTFPSLPVHGTLSGTPPQLMYAPAAQFSGSDSFSFQVSDGVQSSTIAQVSITVRPVNDPPVLLAQVYARTIPEDYYAIVNIPVATDVEGDPISYLVKSPPAHGTATISGQIITYRPQANYFGTDTFIFVASDGMAESETSRLDVTIEAVNDAPTVGNVSRTTFEDTPVSVPLAYSDVENDPLSVTVNAPVNGTVTGTPPSLLYSPKANFNGQDSFTYTVSDGKATSNGSVTINITAVNDPPVAQGQSVETNVGVALNITLTATDVDNTRMQYFMIGPPSPVHGMLFTMSGQPISPGGYIYLPNPPAPPAMSVTVQYRPFTGYAGTDSFTFRANDGSRLSDPATVSITVKQLNRPPVAQAQQVEVAEDATRSITLSAADPDGNPLTYSIKSQPTHGTLTGSGATVTYAPAANYFGSDRFTFAASDGLVESNIAAVDITVTPVNDAPVATPQTVLVTEDSPVTIQLSGSDVEGDPLTFAVTTNPQQGTVTGDQPSLLYTPSQDYNGPDSLSFVARDGVAESAPALVAITVVPVNDPPVITGFSPAESAISMFAEETLQFSLTATDIDTPQTSLSFPWTLDNLLIGEEQMLTFTPSEDQAREAPYTLTGAVSDGEFSATHDWSVTVKPACQQILVDNTDEGFSATGTWQVASTPVGFHGADYLVRMGEGSATWQLPIAKPCRYRVFLRWPTGMEQKKARYRIYYEGGLYDELVADQRAQGGTWVPVGVYDLSADGGAKIVLLGGDDPAAADAVLLERVSTPADVILDDAQGAPLVTVVGSWSSDTKDAFRESLLTTAAGTGLKSVTWKPVGLETGTYDVYAWWTKIPPKDNHAGYQLTLGETDQVMLVRNQKVDYGSWQYLGGFHFDGATAAVTLTDQADGDVVADAVKLIYRDIRPALLVDDDQAQYQGNWTLQPIASGIVGTTYRTIAKGSGGTVTWPLPVAQSGSYEVMASLPAAHDRARTAAYLLTRGDEQQTVVVDQSAVSNWVTLGTWAFDPAVQNSLTLLQNSDRAVGADAVLLVPKVEIPVPEGW